MADQRNQDRQSRLSAALRENLKRRKQQLRGRAGAAARRDADVPEGRPDDGESGEDAEIRNDRG